MNIETKVKKLVQQYKKIMKLRGWKFEIVITDKNLKNDFAQVLWDPSKKDVDIIISNEILYTQQLEKIIIHELTHILLSSYTIYVREIIDFLESNKDNICKLNFKKIKNKLDAIEENTVDKIVNLIKGV